MGGSGEHYRRRYTRSYRPHGFEDVVDDRRRRHFSTRNYTGSGLRFPRLFTHDCLLDLLSAEAESGKCSD